MTTSSSASPSPLEALRSLELFRALKDDVLQRLAAGMNPVAVKSGSTLMKQGETGDMMYVLLSGALTIHVTGADGTRTRLGRMEPVTLVGEMPVILGGTRSADVVADGDCELFALPKAAMDEVMETSAESLAHLTSIVTRRLRRQQLASVLRNLMGGELEAGVLEEFEQNIEWVHVPRGKALFRQGDPPDSWYIVVSGRLQVVAEGSGPPRVLNEVGRGESVGEMALLTNDARSASLYALRDTELIRVAREHFHSIMLRHPRVLMGLTQTLVRRVSKGHGRRKRQTLSVAVVPAQPGAPVEEVARGLVQSFSRLGETLHLSVQQLGAMGVVRDAGKVPEGHPQWQRFATWLEERADQTSFIVFEADRTATPWTQRCVRSADLAVIVADADGPSAPGEVETLLEHADGATRGIRRTLLLVHPEDRKQPSGTAAWLKPRKLEAHLHVRRASGADMDRVARLVSGNGVGLALGGGAARGFAHIGVFKAMRELGIPIDYLGGTSMGSIMACQYAVGYSVEEMLELNREIAATEPFTEYTVPMVALLKSAKIDESARMAFRDINMEDAWTTCFAVSANLTTAEMVIHDSGPAWIATRASGSLPGVVVPVIRGNHLLVDGGIINNMPGDVMRARCGGPVIAVNVSPEEELPVPEGGIPSQWSIFWNKVLPGGETVKVPSVSDILMRTLMIGSAQKTYQVAREADLYLAPPIEKFGMLDFDVMDEIADIGYRYAMEKMPGWNWRALVEQRGR